MFVLGTAGHVDHGKSTLITRLTGIDPDRLAEEKKRGLTIDLGFAWFTLPSGREVGIVDVPGHERFVHNMLAGAGQVDGVIFVVDANEGWRPQSEEHLAIIDLLGARAGVVALTKSDLVAETSSVAAAVAGRLQGTVLEHAEIVPVSAVTGDGLGSLSAAIDRMLSFEPVDTGRPRLYVDRSFTIKGTGTVVTGTLTGGSLHEGDAIVVLPAGTSARIRGLQTHQTKRASASPTSRVALNLAGLERHEVRRGDAVVLPGQWRPSLTIDVALRPVRSLDHALSGRGAYSLHAGTAEVPARLRFVGADGLAPGDALAYARLTLGGEVVAAPGDRIVVRDTGRQQTVAGGVVLDAHPVGQPSAEWLKVRQESLPAVADRVVEERGVVATADLDWLAPGAPPEDAHRLQSFVASQAWIRHTRWQMHQTLEAFHRQHPLETGMPREQLRASLGIDDARLFAEVIADAGVVEDGTLVRLAAHRVTLSPELEAAREALIKELDAGGFSPPSVTDLTGRFGAALLKALTEAGELVRVSADIVFTSERLDEAKHLIAQATKDGGVTASAVRELLGTSRKYAIPLLEHLDQTGFTKRTGDLRTVRG